MKQATGLIVGNPILVVVDIQQGGALSAEKSGIAIMDGYKQLVSRAEHIVAAARRASLPIVFFQEVHRRSGIDFGRELDGAEGVHCLEGDPGTELWPTLRPSEAEYHLPKRRYSGFFATEFDLLLRSLQSSTLILIGGLTDVCVHYTFVDAHQRDYHVRVVKDCVIGSSMQAHSAALDAMAYLQSGAQISTDEAIAAFDAMVPSATVAAGL